MKAIIKYINYSNCKEIEKSYTVPSKITSKTIAKFNKIDEDMMDAVEIEDCDDYGCEVTCNNRKFIDIQELLEWAEYR